MDNLDGQGAQPEEATRTAVRAAGDSTIAQYESWMQTNGAAHLLRAARESGIMERLRERQHTLEELCESLSLETATASLLIEGLVAIGFVERYEDDLALARAGHLLCQYDEDLGDHVWRRLSDRLKPGHDGTPQDGTPGDLSDFRARLAATQWIHTAAAMQAAEILDIGGSESPAGPKILDLGCGSAVWSCAMAHRDAGTTVVAVDEAAPLKSARSTADSIGLGDRLSTIESDPANVTVGENNFDLTILAQVLSCYSDKQASELLSKAVSATKSGGRVVVPDFYVGPGRAGLQESLNRLTVHLATPNGRVRELRECQQMFLDAGTKTIQFTYLAASEAGLGMIVAEVD